MDYFDLTCYFADKKIVRQDIYAIRLEFGSEKGKKNMCAYQKRKLIMLFKFSKCLAQLIAETFWCFKDK